MNPKSPTFQRTPSDTAADLAQRAASSLEDVKDYAADVANDVARTGRAAGEQVQEVAGHMRGALDKSLADQPMATLAVAAAVGFVLGALWKS